MESELSYESQTRVAFFKGDLGGLLDTSSAEVDLDSVIIRAEDIGEEQGEQGGIVISRGQAMVRNESTSIVLENAHVIAEDTRESVPPNSPVCADQSNTPESGRESTPQNIQVVTEVPSGVVVENPSAVEQERDTTSPSSQVIVDGLQGVIVENLCTEREAGDTAPQLPTSEAIITEEQGCVILGNPDAQVEERDTALTRRPHSGSGIEGNVPLDDQVLVHGPLVIKSLKGI